MMKSIVLCADDYGQDPLVSNAIISLVKRQRITATSCLVNSVYWQEHAKWLQPYVKQVDLGLHFNLTEGMAISKAYQAKYGSHFDALPQIIFKTQCRLLDIQTIAAECMAQLKTFKSAMGFYPLYIDGHQHIHQFPQIREAIINAYDTLVPKKHQYLRCVNESISWQDAWNNPKKIVLFCLGRQAFIRLFERKKHSA